MSDTNAFFSLNNTVKSISPTDMAQTANYLAVVEAFSRITYKSIYVIDYEKKGFEYVSENPLFLCGFTVEEVKKMGYDFYFKNVTDEDLDLLLKINTAGFAFYETLPIEERKAYTISYDFHLKIGERKTILVNQKLTPLFLADNGKIWKAICMVSLSSQTKSGNVVIYKNGSNKIFSYDLKDNYWKTTERVILTDREKEIIQYAARGYTINSIAENICLSPDTVKFHRKKIFEKLEVTTISEAIAYVTINKLI